MEELVGPKIPQVRANAAKFKFNDRLLHLAIVCPEEYVSAVNWNKDSVAILLHIGYMYARYDLLTLGNYSTDFDNYETPYLARIIDDFTKHYTELSAGPIDITIEARIAGHSLQHISVDYHVAKQSIARHVLEAADITLDRPGLNRLEQMLATYAGGIIPPHITCGRRCGKYEVSSITYLFNNIDDCRQTTTTTKFIY